MSLKRKYEYVPDTIDDDMTQCDSQESLDMAESQRWDSMAVNIGDKETTTERDTQTTSSSFSSSSTQTNFTAIDEEKNTLANNAFGALVGHELDCQINERVDIYGDLEGKCKRGLKVEYAGKKQYVGSGYLKMLRYELFDNRILPSGIAIQTILPASRLPVINESLYPVGGVVLQNLPSIVCGWVVNAQPGEYVLDMCAAPGNKTTHLAEMSNDKAFITAIDKTAQKVAKIKESCKTQGVTCVNAYAFDSTKCYSEESSGVVSGPPFPSNSFDKILLDAPCSGLGQRPQLHNKMTPKMIQSYKFVQRKLFAAAVEILKENGRLIYSTCTITDEENEGMVTWVLEKFPCLKLIPAVPLLGGPGLPDKGLNDEQRSMVQRFGPEIDALRPVEDIYRDSIGFFIAAFTKISPVIKY